MLFTGLFSAGRALFWYYVLKFKVKYILQLEYQQQVDTCVHIDFHWNSCSPLKLWCEWQCLRCLQIVRCDMEGSGLSSDQGCPIIRNTGICVGLCRVKGIISWQYLREFTFTAFKLPNLFIHLVQEEHCSVDRRVLVRRLFTVIVP